MFRTNRLIKLENKNNSVLEKSGSDRGFQVRPYKHHWNLLSASNWLLNSSPPTLLETTSQMHYLQVSVRHGTLSRKSCRTIVSTSPSVATIAFTGPGWQARFPDTPRQISCSQKEIKLSYHTRFSKSIQYKTKSTSMIWVPYEAHKTGQESHLPSFDLTAGHSDRRAILPKYGSPPAKYRKETN